MRNFNPDVTPETLDTLRRQLGLDQPVAVQYMTWLTGVSVRIGDQREILAQPDVPCSFVGAINLTLCNKGGGILREI